MLTQFFIELPRTSLSINVALWHHEDHNPLDLGGRLGPIMLR